MNLSQDFEYYMTSNFMRESRNEADDGTFGVSWGPAPH
jgi:hypothetical protein